MGSFDSTCALSGLPITHGDDVKYFLLTENPYEDSLVCYSHDMWFPRSTPVRAKYNDYGSIEAYDESSPGVYAIVAALTQDLIEVGTGDNSCHDVPTSKGMDFGRVLNAVWERRILVTREFERRPSMKKDDEVPDGLPTLQQISKLLNEAGYPTNDGHDTVMGNDGSYHVDEKDHGWVRIREAGYGEGDSLEILLPLLKDYAAIITAGSGSYSGRCEIQVMPLPADPEKYLSFLDRDKTKPCKVFQAIILQEVWDALCEIGNYKKHRTAIQKEWDSNVESWRLQLESEAAREELLESAKDPELLALLREMKSFRDPSSSVYSYIPFTMGIGEHFNLVTERHAQTLFTDDQIKEYLDDIAGFSCIQEMIYRIRYWWRPTFSCGSQFGEYGEHEDWHKILVHVSGLLKVKHNYEEEDYEEDEE